MFISGGDHIFATVCMSYRALKPTWPNLRTRTFLKTTATCQLNMSVNDMWVGFKPGFVETVERLIRSKMTKTKYSVPWIDATIKRLVTKRHKLYLRARKSKDPDVKIHYKRFRAHVQKVLRDAYWKYVSNIFTFENDSSDPDTPKPEKIKKFWSFIKSLKKDAYGIT